MSAPNINHPTVAGAINDEEKNGEEEKEEIEQPPWEINPLWKSRPQTVPPLGLNLLWFGILP
jgi:hypothetical protein